MTPQTQQIEHITRQFISDLETALNDRTTARLRDALGVVGIPTPAKRGPGRPPGKARKKMPIQLCPVPRCENRAAPAYGQVCGDHKNVAKSKIKKYREARRAAKARG